MFGVPLPIKPLDTRQRRVGQVPKGLAYEGTRFVTIKSLAELLTFFFGSQTYLAYDDLLGSIHQKPENVEISDR